MSPKFLHNATSRDLSPRHDFTARRDAVRARVSSRPRREAARTAATWPATTPRSDLSGPELERVAVRQLVARHRRCTEAFVLVSTIALLIPEVPITPMQHSTPPSLRLSTRFMSAPQKRAHRGAHGVHDSSCSAPRSKVLHVLKLTQAWLAKLPPCVCTSLAAATSLLEASGRCHESARLVPGEVRSSSN